VSAAATGSPEAGDVLVVPVPLGPGTRAWFTGRARAGSPPPPVGAAGNLSHRRPHLPSRLSEDRADAFAQMGIAAEAVVWMHQVHGDAVAVVDDATPPGAELRGVDAVVTATPGRALAVQVADCVPVLFASDAGVVGAAHAGRRGVELGVVPATLARMADLGADPAGVRAVIGPAIGGCCYEVPGEMRDDLADDHPVAAGTTTWRTPSLDLPAAVEAVLHDHAVGQVTRVGGCTHCDPDDRWFSHRADPAAGRQVGVVVLTGASV
jgi:YfiH family protein